MIYVINDDEDNDEMYVYFEVDIGFKYGFSYCSKFFCYNGMKF